MSGATHTEAPARAALDDAAFQRVLHGNAFEREPRRRHGWRRTLRALWRRLWQPSPWEHAR